MNSLAGSNLRWVRAKDRKKLPHISACYAIYLRSTLLYVGQAVDLKRRFYLHQIDANLICYREFSGNPCDVTVRYIPCEKQELRELEEHLIRTLKPQMNVRCR